MLSQALRAAGVIPGESLSSSALVAAARVALERGHDAPALHRLLEVPSASDIALAGRYDVVDGLRP